MAKRKVKEKYTSQTGFADFFNFTSCIDAIASCKGFQVFDLSKDELLSPEDYYPLLDPNFDAHCINGNNYGASGDILTISNNQVLVYDCN